MKKFLLGTTALISLSAASAAMAGGSHAPAAAAPANTGGLTVMVGGSLNFQSAFINQDEDAALGNANESDMVFTNDTRINVTAAGSTEDFDYGAVVSLFADTGADRDARIATAPTQFGAGDKAYIYVENDSFGRVEGGANVSASDSMEVDASRVARATGGVDGDATYYITPGGTTAATTSGLSTWRTRSNLDLGGDASNAAIANKLTYYTPRFSGFQLGVSFTPDTGNIGTTNSLSLDNDAGQFENVFAGGISFEGDVSDGVTLMASAVGETGSSQVSTVNDLSEYSLGLGLEFEGFSVAGNYSDLGDSGLATAATVNTDSSLWSIGAGYENGPYGVSVTYLDATSGTGVAQGAAVGGENEFTNLVVGADYQMAPGLTPYIEAAFFDAEAGATNATEQNSGEVILVGANLAF